MVETYEFANEMRYRWGKERNLKRDRWFPLFPFIGLVFMYWKYKRTADWPK
jgi:hypothetical protein